MKKSLIFIKNHFVLKIIINHLNGPKTKIECLWPARFSYLRYDFTKLGDDSQMPNRHYTKD